MLENDLPAAALLVLRSAQATQTHCAGHTTVWHSWGDGPALVLFHGGSGSWTHWIRNVQVFAAAGWRVHVPDLPGFGDSVAATGAKDATDLVEPVAAGMRELAGARCPVVAFSFGTVVAGLLTSRMPDMVSRLVLVGAPCAGIRNALKMTLWHRLASEERRAAQRSNLGTLMLHKPEAIDDLAFAIHVANLERDRLRGRTSARTDLLTRTLATVNVPIDAIYGEQDAVFRGRLDELESAYRKLPHFGKMVRIPAAGHWVQYEAASQFNSTVLGLLSS